MATILFIIALIAIFHFIYEAIVMPSLRLQFRYRLFEQRDKLRQLKCNDVQVSDEMFDYAESYINSSIRQLPYLSISVYYASEREYDESELFRNEIQKGIDLIESCQNEGLKQILKKSTTTSIYGLVCNSGAWFLYLLPIFLVMIILNKMKIVSFGIYKQIQKITLTPDKKFDSFIHDSNNYSVN